ncbi:acetate/propionate family kinase [Pseudoruegeria sp. HB172150]|uniref:acetate/propionate family kinase n=1 Tax=Pseudoruegeria sp. HB172150 TaxID=2721164 RepID=UPI001551B25C|nr:acetate kinase [Pseudoruegeria sp. HB172150]
MLLVVNTGSSSIKTAVFREDLSEAIAGRITGIGTSTGAELKLGDTRHAVYAPDHHAAFAALFAALQNAGIDDIVAAGHRIVHGGTAATAPARLTDEVIGIIEANIPLAPLHNPPGLAGIRAMAAARPDLPQYASFDTAFHAGQDPLITSYAIPAQYRDAGIRRYGFHGLSYAGMVAQFGDALPERLLAMHLGAGVSLCAIRNGQSCATTMGYSPLSGPTMATRSGDIDGMAVLRMARELGIDEAERVLNKESGLRALGGHADMQALMAEGTEEAKFAIAHFVTSIARQAGGLISVMGGVDAVAYTGGIGENSAEIRQMIMDKLAWLGALEVHIIPAEEEKQIARDAYAVIARGE